MKACQCDRCKQYFTLDKGYKRIEVETINCNGRIQDNYYYDLCPTCYKKLTSFLNYLENNEGDNND